MLSPPVVGRLGRAAHRAPSSFRAAPFSLMPPLSPRNGAKRVVPEWLRHYISQISQIEPPHFTKNNSLSPCSSLRRTFGGGCFLQQKLTGPRL